MGHVNMGSNPDLQPRSSSDRIRLVLAATLFVAGLLACNTRYPDFTDFSDLANFNRDLATEIDIPVTGAFGELLEPSTTWLDENRFVVDRQLKARLDEKWNEVFLAAFDVRQSKLQLLSETPLNRLCGKDHKTFLGRQDLLHDGELAFGLRCYYTGPFSPETGLRGYTTYLYTWNAKTSEFKRLFNFEDGPHERKYGIAWFNPSPDRAKFLYSVGGSFSGKMYLVDDFNRIESLVPDFYLAKSPTWSSDGSTIAFAGVKTNAAPPPTRIVSFAQIAPQASQPKDLYLLDVNDGSIREIQFGFRFIGMIEWLPDSSRFLSFNGSKGNVHGIWLIDLEAGQITRIWDDSSTFGWSPDGKLLILDYVDRTEDNHYIFQTFLVQSPRLPPAVRMAFGSSCLAEPSNALLPADLKFYLCLPLELDYTELAASTERS